MPRMAHVARQTTFFLFPILIIPVLGMESPQRDPRPPTLPTTIQVGPDATHDETDYHLMILRMDAIQISPELLCLRHPTLYRHHPYMPAMTSCKGCPFRKALSVRTWHHIRPNYAPHRRIVLHNIDMDNITLHMPYHDLQS